MYCIWFLPSLQIAKCRLVHLEVGPTIILNVLPKNEVRIKIRIWQNYLNPLDSDPAHNRTDKRIHLIYVGMKLNAIASHESTVHLWRRGVRNSNPYSLLSFFQKSDLSAILKRQLLKWSVSRDFTFRPLRHLDHG